VQKPSIGRIVIVPMDPASNNGATEAPAIISRVWNDNVVNVRVLPDDSNEVLSRTSVTLYPSSAEAADANATGTHHAWWPGRV
jgi:hypothetical protein